MSPTPASKSASMFASYDASKHRKMPAWAVPLLSFAVAIHIVIFVTMWIKSIWEIEQLEPPKGTSDIAFAPPPPPPPPPPKGGAKPKDQQVVPKKIKVKDIVQPVKQEKREQVVQTSNADPNGVEGGQEGGQENGDPNGVLGAPPPPPPPPPPPAPPQIVAPTALEASRIAGEKNIVPDDVTKTEIQRSGKTQIVGSYKLCLNAAGAITSVNQLKSTGFASYDQKIVRTIRGEWQYKPFEVNGKAVPVCTAVTFIYSQH
jgi:periplasmic protein TonB